MASENEGRVTMLMEKKVPNLRDSMMMVLRT
jgi:hypothetical protein